MHLIPSMWCRANVQQLVSLAQKTLEIANWSCLLFVDCLLEQKSYMRNSWLSDWRITVVFHCQIDGCYKIVSLPFTSAGNVHLQWIDFLLVDWSVVCLWISVSPDGQSRLHPHTVGEQPRHSHVFLLPQRAGRLGAGGRTTVRAPLLSNYNHSSFFKFHLYCLSVNI